MSADVPKKPPRKKNDRGQRRSHATRLTTRDERPRPASEPGAKRARGEVAREKVLHAALECFGAFGFAGTSTRAVAERAGLSHPLLLYHFESKEQLWRSTMEDVFARYHAAMDARFAQVDPEDAAAGLRAFIENFVEFSAKVPQLHRIMTQQSTQGSERIHWLVERYLRPAFEKVCAMIRRGQAQGTVRRGSPDRLYYAVIGLGGTLMSVSTEFRVLAGKDVFAPEEIRSTIEGVCEHLFV